MDMCALVQLILEYIDFKGGGMANQFKNLPHLLGAITNIDGKEMERSLKSIKAELRKRQKLFAEAEVNHIDKYIQEYKAGKVDIPIPHLILIVDEFAELKAEQPEFMKELVSAARIGRSLGVHLILATQKPSGQVDDQIWSNSKFKLCLKVQSQEDSNEVLKSPLAAEIKEPGRAYLQVGNNEIFELFQSAYSGAPAKMIDAKVNSLNNEINQLNSQISQLRTKVRNRESQIRELNQLKNKYQRLLNDFAKRQLQRKNKLSQNFSQKPNVKFMASYIKGMGALLSGNEYRNAYNGLNAAIIKISNTIKSIQREIDGLNRDIRLKENNISSKRRYINSYQEKIRRTDADLSYRRQRIRYWKNQMRYAV